jgi:hypothetical protein
METITEPPSLQPNTLRNCLINRMTMNMRVIETGTKSGGQQPKCGVNQTNTSYCYCNHRQSHRCASSSSSTVINSLPPTQIHIQTVQ